VFEYIGISFPAHFEAATSFLLKSMLQGLVEEHCKLPAGPADKYVLDTAKKSNFIECLVNNNLSPVWLKFVSPDVKLYC